MELSEKLLIQKKGSMYNGKRRDVSAHIHERLKVGRILQISLKEHLFSSYYATRAVLITVLYALCLSFFISKLNEKPEQQYLSFLPRGGEG